MSVCQACPPGVPGWILGEGGSCYHESVVSLNWYDSQQYCKDKGGYLLEIDSAEEQNLIESLIPMDSGVAYWVGLERKPDGRWVWSESKTEAAFTNWGHGEPNNAHANDVEGDIGENCVHIDEPQDKNGKWNDFSCHCSTECLIAGSVEPIFALCESGPLSDNVTEYYKEQFRPQFHFSPEVAWTNDPNGLVYYGGLYHLFYQHNPDNTVWGPMHWGHATSTDLLHWDHLPIALYPDNIGTIFSGSAVVDYDNTGGFGQEGQAPLIAFYSYNVQSQGLAYSVDGNNFVKYAGNPVIPKPEGVKDFRDPKVFWHSETSKWVSIISQGDHAVLYSSTNFVDWQFLSQFKPEQSFGWECPDIFPLSIDGDTVWVVTVANNRYFIGNFDGQTFTPFNEEMKILDYGRDNYAAVTFNNMERRVSIGWMLTWAYANNIPTTTWRGSMTIPREISLTKINDQFYLKSFPVPEIESIMTERLLLPEIIVEEGEIYEVLEGVNQAEISFRTSNSFNLYLQNLRGEHLKFIYDSQAQTFTINREHSGLTDFHNSFKNDMEMNLLSQTVSDSRHFHLLVDWSSVEVFIDGGVSVMTARMFPTERYSAAVMENTNQGGQLVITDLRVRRAQSVWGDF